MQSPRKKENEADHQIDGGGHLPRNEEAGNDLERDEKAANKRMRLRSVVSAVCSLNEEDYVCKSHFN